MDFLLSFLPSRFPNFQCLAYRKSEKLEKDAVSHSPSLLPSDWSSSVVVIFCRRDAQFTNGLIFFTPSVVVWAGETVGAGVGFLSLVLAETLTGGSEVASPERFGFFAGSELPSAGEGVGAAVGFLSRVLAETRTGGSVVASPEERWGLCWGRRRWLNPVIGLMALGFVSGGESRVNCVVT